MGVLDEETLVWLATDTSVDAESGVPLSAVVFMLYYGLGLKTYLLKAADKLLQTFAPMPKDLGATSVYLAGSCAQGFYINTKQLEDARDFDIVTIFKKYVVEEEDVFKIDEENDGSRVLYQRTKPDIENVQNIITDDADESTPSVQERPYFLIETLPDTKPGYVLLRKCNCKDDPNAPRAFISSSEVTEVRKKYWQEMWDRKFEENDDLPFGAIWTTGPAVTVALRHEEERQTLPVEADLVFALKYPGWPKLAEEWLHRLRISGWPSSELIEKIKNVGCLIVPKGYFGSENEKYEWRISFSLCEVMLSRSLSAIHRELLQICKALITEPQYSKDVPHLGDIPSYFMLHTLFWMNEEIEPGQWKSANLATLLFKFLDRLMKALLEKSLPHYFIPTINLMEKYSSEIYISSDGFKMRTDRKFAFILFGLMRIRKDPLGQLLQQRRFLHIPGALYEKIFRSLTDNLQESKTADRRLFAETLVKIAQFHQSNGDFFTALKYAEDAYKLEMLLSSSEQMDNLSAKILHTLIKSYYQTGDLLTALKYSDKVYPFIQSSMLSNVDETDVCKLVAESLQLRGRLLLSTSSGYEWEIKCNIEVEAIKLFKDAMQLYPIPKSFLETINACLYLGQLNEAEELLLRLEAGQLSNQSDCAVEILYQRCASANQQNAITQEIQSQSSDTTNAETEETIKQGTKVNAVFERSESNCNVEILYQRCPTPDQQTPNTQDNMQPHTIDESSPYNDTDEVTERCAEENISSDGGHSAITSGAIAVTSQNRGEHSDHLSANSAHSETGHRKTSENTVSLHSDDENGETQTIDENSVITLEMESIYLYAVSVFLKELGYTDFSKSVLGMLKDSTEESAYHTAIRLQMLEENFIHTKPTRWIVSGEPYLPVNDVDYIVFTTSDTPIIDDVIKTCMEQNKRGFLKLPLYSAIFHAQIECKKARNLGIESFLTFTKMKETIDNHMKVAASETSNKFEMDKVFDDYYECLGIVAGHLREFGDEFSARSVSKASVERDKTITVHDRAISWIGMLMELVPASEIENSSLVSLLG